MVSVGPSVGPQTPSSDKPDSTTGKTIQASSEYPQLETVRYVETRTFLGNEAYRRQVSNSVGRKFSRRVGCMPSKSPLLGTTALNLARESVDLEDVFAGKRTVVVFLRHYG